MVKGNKFKPGEPPLKKRKLLNAAVLEASTAQTTCDVLTAQQISEEPNKHKASTQPIKGAHGTVASHGPTGGQDKLSDTAACNRKRNKLQTDAGKSGGPTEAVAPPQDRAVQKGDLRQQTARSTIRKAKRKINHLVPAGMPEAALQAEAALDNGAKAKRRRKQKAVHQDHGKQIQLQTSVAQPQQGAIGNSNWATLKAVIGAGQKKDVHHKGSMPPAATDAKRPQPLGPNVEPTQVLAIDCEMVGVGPDGVRSSLARVCIVNDQGNVLMDKFVRQKERVTDYRTRWSGIRPEDVRDHVAHLFEDVQKEAAALFEGRVLVGHAIHNDLKALLLSHPGKMIRDTARYPPLMRPSAPGRKPKPKALRHLAFEVLGLGIQEGEHSPVEDARAALYLYQRHAKEWERNIQKGTVSKLLPQGKVGGRKGTGAVKTLAAFAATDVMVDL